jgi:hypothetical protein
VTHGHLLQHGDFISNLFGTPKKRPSVLRLARSPTEADTGVPTMCSRPAIRRLLITFAA